MPTIRTSLTTLALLGAAAALTACGSMSSPAAPAFNQSSLPATVQVPAGQRIAMETVGAGDITYECRAKKDMPSAFEWVFVGPDAKLMDRSGKVVGRYYGPPATWESNDGSKVIATQLAVAPARAGNIPLQLVKANNLQDATNKRNINADAKLKELFGKPQVSMFELAGLIGKHVS